MYDSTTFVGKGIRFFLDSNIMTYVAFFEGYLCEGTRVEHDSAVEHWYRTSRTRPGSQVLHEVKALRILYLLDDQAHFDWLFSDTGLDELRRIRNQSRRSAHHHLVDRLIEHRHDIYEEECRRTNQKVRAELAARLFPPIPKGMMDDALQYCEAELVESDYFLTNDHRFINQARKSAANVAASKVSELPFVARVLK
jgi:hypothetical protein